MPHLATRSGDGLAIEVKPNVTAREDRGIIRRVEQVLPEEVGHHRGATLARLEEWQATDGPELKLELIHVAGVEREVPGVMGSRGQLIDQQPPVAALEELDCEDAHHVERVEDSSCQSPGKGDAIG